MYILLEYEVLPLIRGKEIALTSSLWLNLQLNSLNFKILYPYKCFSSYDIGNEHNDASLNYANYMQRGKALDIFSTFKLSAFRSDF